MIDITAASITDYEQLLENNRTTEQKLLSIHNGGSSVSELFELHVPYMMVYESNHSQLTHNMIINISPALYCRTAIPSGFTHFSTNRVLHQHDFFELMFVLSGTVSQRIEYQYYHYSVGQACLLNRNIRHCENFSTDFEAVFLLLSNEILSHLLEHDIQYSSEGASHNYFGSIYQLIRQNQRTKYYSAKDYIDFIPLEQPSENSTLMLKLQALINQVIEETREQRPGCIFFIEGLISRFFSILEDPGLYRKVQYTLSGSTEELLLSKIGHLLEERNGRISRNELEEMMNYNGDYLNRIIKKYTGLTLTEYGLMFSLKEAHNLLLHSDKSICDIISELGFSNRNYFYKIFSRKYGMTPKEYREKNR